MIARQYFHLGQAIIGKTNEVLQNIQQPLPLKDSLKESIELSILGIFVVTVGSLPLHEAVFPRGNGASLGSHHVTHNADGVVDEHGGNLMHIVPKLKICLTGIRLLT